jgi:hypothetical protein
MKNFEGREKFNHSLHKVGLTWRVEEDESILLESLKEGFGGHERDRAASPLLRVGLRLERSWQTAKILAGKGNLEINLHIQLELFIPLKFKPGCTNYATSFYTIDKNRYIVLYLQEYISNTFTKLLACERLILNLRAEGLQLLFLHQADHLIPILVVQDSGQTL